MKDYQSGVTTHVTYQAGTAASQQAFAAIVAAGDGKQPPQWVTPAEAALGAGTALAVLADTVWQAVNAPLFLADSKADLAIALEAALRSDAQVVLMEEQSASALASVLARLKQEADSGNRKLLLMPCADAQQAKLLAQQANDPRLVIVAPAAMQGEINLAGAVLLRFLEECGGQWQTLPDHVAEGIWPTALTDDDIRDLLLCGVTPLVQGEGAFVPRGVTTRTKNADGTADGMLRSIAAAITLDEVLDRLEQDLRQKLAQGALTVDGVRAVLYHSLEELTLAGKIAQIDTVQVTPDAADETVCDAVVGFTLTQSVNRVELHAAVTN